MSTVPTDTQIIVDRLEQFAADFAKRFGSALSALSENVPRDLHEAVCYSALAGGKRLRPYLVTRCCELFGGSADDAFPAAAAVECIHTFSLVHDDLPAMDDDDLRRGQPTTHKRFGEAMAILAGDALLTLAFELVASHGPGAARAAIVAELARGAGWSGMIGGQVKDMLGERQPPSRELTQAIHAQKTAALFASSCRAGALSADASADEVEMAGTYGLHLGHTFQIADDLLDVTSTVEKMGKGVGKDAGIGKQTYPLAVGMEESKEAARASAEAAVDAMSALGPEADDLRALAVFVVQRQH